MAWNEPGGNNSPGKRNPWGQRPNQGPPDLDEVLRNLKKKFAALLGAGGGKGGDIGKTSDGGGSSGAAGASIGLIALVLGVLWLATGVYQVDAAERALITRFGEFVRISQPGVGMHLPWPIETKQIVNISSIDVFTDQTRMLTSDENLVDIDLEVQFRRVDPVAYAFNVRDPDATLGEVSESAIREVIGRAKLDAVLESGRQAIAASTKEQVQKTLDSYKTGLEITSVNLKDVKVPEQVAPSQQDAIKAREDKVRYSLEAQAYSNDILPKAEGSAGRLIQDAEAYKAQKIAEAVGESERFLKLLPEYQRAPQVTRERLYLETIELIYARSKKVLLDTKSDGNVIYLPLDRLVEQSRASNVAAGTANNTNSVVVESTATQDARSRGVR
ncbi:MAG: FtsH protease activity modulator HflK [Steroidobacteraceae bacterium]